MERLAALSLALGLAACAPLPAPLPGPGPAPGAYRAVGTEPFWSLTLDGRDMIFTEAARPGQRIVVPQPRVIVGFAGEIYQTPRMGVNIVHSRCSDGMSDRIYPDKVQLRVDGRSFEGCGGDPVASESRLQDSSWSVLAVNGRATGGGPRFTLAFTRDRLSGQFGCNRMSGTYRASPNGLTAGPIIATRMACPDMRFEDEAGRILAQPVTLRTLPDLDLELANSAGTIRLRRQN
ncbi:MULTISPECIES: META domain-containing protein [Sphingomonas]|uniref:META domain-containing protein n=1 Tax=Sphingomonas TaxID=13687 RepID=UPI0013B3A9DE|nr:MULTISPECIES: META domain-containing protein [Sphingomonas]